MILLLDIVTTAAILFTVASGLMIILGVMKLINFAHGAFLTVGGYAAYMATAAGVSPWLSAPVALVLGFATLSDVHWSMSGLVILMTLVGGLGTLSGPIVGAFVIVALENKLGDIGSLLASATGIQWFNGLGESVSMVTGVIFVVCVLAFRKGIVGSFSRQHE